METKLLLVISVALPFFILTVAKPKPCFYLFLIARPVIDNIDMLRTQAVVGSLNALQIIGIIWPLLLIVICVGRKSYLFKEPLGNIYLVFVFLCIPSIFLTDSWFDGAAEWLKLFTFWPVFIFVSSLCAQEQDRKRLFLAILIASIYPITRYVISFATGQTVMVGGVERITGGYFQQAPISGLLFLFVPAYLYFISTTDRLWKKLALYFGILLILVSIYATQYRSVLVGVFVLISVYLLLNKKVALQAGVILAAVAAFLLLPFLQERFAQLPVLLDRLPILMDPTDGRFDKLLSGRFGIWRNALGIYFNDFTILNLLFGFGYKTLGIATHNDYLGYLLHNGFFAFMSFLFFIGIAIVYGFLKLPDSSAKVILSLIIGSCVVALSENFFVSVRNLLYMGTYSGILATITQTVEVRSKGLLHSVSGV